MTPLRLLLSTLGIGAALAACSESPVQAQIAPEELSVVTLDAPQPHWVWLNDIAFMHMVDGRAYLVDADSGTFLGMVSGGYGHAVLQLPEGKSEFYNAETYYARGTRGERTDVLTIYDEKTLAPVAEVEIPPKRFQGMPLIGGATLTDGGRFSLVYNFTPAQSVTVVDVEDRRLVGEYDTGGCALVFPTGPRRFFMLCADGGLLDVVLNETGEVVARNNVDPFFDIEEDPVTEKPVRVGDSWYFVSFHNRVYPVRGTADGPKVGESWRLTSDEEFEAGWRIGGIQLLAAHGPTRKLYALMHQGSEGSHKDPGTEIWMFDLESGTRERRIALERPASAIAVSQDDDPLLYAVMIGDQSLHVHDAETGELLRTIEELGMTMTVIQTPPVGD